MHPWRKQVRNRYQVLFNGVLVASILASTFAPGALYAQEPPSEDQQPTKVFIPLVNTGEDMSQRALELVASQTGVPLSALSVSNSSTGSYPLQAATVHEFKVMDNQTGQLYGIALGEQGEEVNATQLAEAEEAAYIAQYGRAEPELSAQLAETSESAAIPVIVWLKESVYAGMTRPAAQAPLEVSDEAEAVEPSDAEATDGELANGEASDLVVQDDVLGIEAQNIQLAQDTFFAEVDAERAAAVEQVTAAAASRLATLGYAATADAYAPVLYAKLPASAIQEVAGWAEVDRVYLDRVNEPDLEVMRATILATAVHALGITGTGVRIAQIEVGGRVALANPFLAGVLQNALFVCAAPSGHSTGVAGIIRSLHAVRRGIAPGAILWAGGSCAGNSGQLQNRSTAAANWGARVLNLSWGSNIGLVPGANDRFYDNMVINLFRTVVKSAGNLGAGCGGNGNVTSPGLGYNVITVGNFNDMNTVPWPGDIMSSCSSWRDPISLHNDRDKPEVAAPGTNINSTTTAAPWTGPIGSGTSFAAPAVTGVAALLIRRNASLAVWPEAIKAILMTTAVHNIEGAARMSEFDGAGGIVANRADNVARGVGGTWGGQAYSCAAPVTSNIANMSLVAGLRTRVTIAWDNDPAYALYASRPSADLDLQIVNAAGAVVASSASWDNTHEIVDFVPAVGGVYRLRVIKFRCDFSPRWLGWAWRRGN